MSIRGLYESEIGDRLARKSLAAFRKIDNSEIDDETPRRKAARSRKCACGSELAHPYVVRGGVFVCTQCATRARLVGGSTITNGCAKCKTLVGRTYLVMRKGQLYCKTCAKEF
jgi:formylmethanofuran dehydrogenase subunit E